MGAGEGQQVSRADYLGGYIGHMTMLFWGNWRILWRLVEEWQILACLLKASCQVERDLAQITFYIPSLRKATLLEYGIWKSKIRSDEIFPVCKDGIDIVPIWGRSWIVYFLFIYFCVCVTPYSSTWRFSLGNEAYPREGGQGWRWKCGLCCCEVLFKAPRLKIFT